VEYLQNYLSWLIAGGVLVLLEFFVPGLVVVFLGLGALLTGGVIFLGWIQNPYYILLCFLLLSVVMLAQLRKVVLRFYPSDSEKSETDEEALVVGQAAHAISHITTHDFSGRIRFVGTTWSARSVEGDIHKGATVEIVGRDNIHYLVKKLKNN